MNKAIQQLTQQVAVNSQRFDAFEKSNNTRLDILEQEIKTCNRNNSTNISNSQRDINIFKQEVSSKLSRFDSNNMRIASLSDMVINAHKRLDAIVGSNITVKAHVKALLG